MGKHGVRERLGFITRRTSNNRLFWFHAASVGELKILSLVIPRLKEKYQDIEFAVSTTTITGRRTAERLFSEFATVFIHPIELKSAVSRTIGRIRPERLVVVETEIWPLTLSIVSKAGIKLYLINGRMSSRSFAWYKFFGSLFGPVIGKFNNILVQTADDAERYLELGAGNTIVIGNIKYDQALAVDEVGAPDVNFDNNDDLIFIAGSLRKGEFDIIIETLYQSFSKELSCRFILVPRHMKDIEALTGKLNEKSIDYALWSDYQNTALTGNIVLVVNTMGELLSFYSIADIAFVGGSLVHIGGHDPVEPASLGKAVIFGPHMENASEAASALLNSGGATEIRDTGQILEVINSGIQNRAMLREMGKKCRVAVESLAGASDKTVKLLMEDIT